MFGINWEIPVGILFTTALIIVWEGYEFYMMKVKFNWQLFNLEYNLFISILNEKHEAFCWTCVCRSYGAKIMRS